jgi:hypothetical protein
MVETGIKPTGKLAPWPFFNGYHIRDVVQLWWCVTIPPLQMLQNKMDLMQCLIDKTDWILGIITNSLCKNKHTSYPQSDESDWSAPSPMICSPQLIFEMEVCGSVAIFHKLGDFNLFLFFHTAQCSTRELWFWWTPNAIAQLNLAMVTQILHLFFFTIMHAAQIQYMAHTLHHHACALTIPFSCAQISIHLRLVLII